MIERVFHQQTATFRFQRQDENMYIVHRVQGLVTLSRFETELQFSAASRGAMGGGKNAIMKTRLKYARAPCSCSRTQCNTFRHVTSTKHPPKECNNTTATLESYKYEYQSGGHFSNESKTLVGWKYVFNFWYFNFKVNALFLFKFFLLFNSKYKCKCYFLYVCDAFMQKSLNPFLLILV